MTPAQIGGKIHKILNETLYRKLTVNELAKVTRLIGKVFDEACSRDEWYNQGYKDAMQTWERKKHMAKHEGWKEAWAQVREVTRLHASDDQLGIIEDLKRAHDKGKA